VARAGLGLAGVAAVSLFVYNSGYGHDALEYLVIGRSLLDGYGLYDFVPSKSWGLYVLAAAWLTIPGADSHAGVTALVVALMAIAVWMTYVTVSDRFGARTGALAGVAIVLASLFTELNYFQPEALVYACGLAAVRTLTSAPDDRPSGAWRAGLWLGAGMAFKAVAAFYAAGMAAWMVADAAGRGRSPWRRVAALAAGIGVALAVPAAWFAGTGRLDAHVYWTFWFPVVEYPANTYWLDKLYTKLLWVWLVIAAAVVAWRRLPADERARLRPLLSLLAAMGLAGLFPLWKTQASHYAFPGAGLLLVCAAIVFDRASGLRPRWRSQGPQLLAAMLALVVVSGVLYRPAAVQRLAWPRSWPDERQLASVVQSRVPDGQAVLSLGEGARLYWLAHRYPNWPVVNTQVQATRLIGERGAILLAALDDPRLALVEFDPGRLVFDDPALFETPGARAFVAGVAARLAARFERRTDLLPGRVLWVRPERAPASGPLE
jgi:hypothetical protein